MGPTDTLKKDHELLRKKLEFLEAAMQVAPEAQFALREMCWSLARMLKEHIQREEQVLAPYSNRIRALTPYRFAQDHVDQQAMLRDVNGLLLRGIKAPVGEVVLPLGHLIEDLREHMEKEECEVFPVVDQIAAQPSHAAPPSSVGSARPLITQTMTVNYVLKIHPQAREIFQAFKVDWEIDGCHCLDELYWRRGVQVDALVQALNHSAAARTLVG